jgi:hypothetical protein
MGITPPLDKLYTNTPEWALGKWLTAWQARDWSAMAEHSQKTWVGKQQDPAAMLEAMFNHSDLTAAEMGRVERHKTDLQAMKQGKDGEAPFAALLNKPDGGVCINAEVTVKITLVYGENNEQVTIKPRLLCERGPYEPDPTGDWGVNPVSALKKD